MTRLDFFKSRIFVIPLIIICTIFLAGCLVLENVAYIFSYFEIETTKPGYSSLVADAEHDVAVFEECDLALKFPKTITVPREFLDSDTSKLESIISYNNQKVFSLKMDKSGDFLTINCNNKDSKKAVANFDEYITKFY